ncbi:MAG: 7,8-dihydropteroate synthase [Nitrospira sp.]|nr:MAG: 7,8-dihydropteroate synthase [Nitrospira sp.]
MKNYTLLAKGRLIPILDCPLLMGIVNITPDSFSDGGCYATVDQAVDQAMRLVEQGANILDLGAESTRPGAAPVGEQEEMDRVLPVLHEVAKRTAVPISVDTMKSRVAREALNMGASIVNDVTAMRFDPNMAAVVAQYGAGVVMMHMQGMPATMQKNPRYDNVADDVRMFFLERIAAAEGAGIAKSQIVLDPGFGFGKLLVHNLDLLNRLSSFDQLGCPMLVGVSRKAFLGKILDRSVRDREWGTAAAVALAVDRGASIVRVHDVASMKDVVMVAAAIRAAALASKQEDYA